MKERKGGNTRVWGSREQEREGEVVDRLPVGWWLHVLGARRELLNLLASVFPLLMWVLNFLEAFLLFFCSIFLPGSCVHLGFFFGECLSAFPELCRCSVIALVGFWHSSLYLSRVLFLPVGLLFVLVVELMSGLTPSTDAGRWLLVACAVSCGDKLLTGRWLGHTQSIHYDISRRLLQSLMVCATVRLIHWRSWIFTFLCISLVMVLRMVCKCLCACVLIHFNFLIGLFECYGSKW